MEDPVTPMPNSELLTDLHARLWESLKHVFNTDRVLLGVTYAINFAGFVMLSLTAAQRPLAAVVASVALLLLNALVMLSLSNSRQEAIKLLKTLVQLYADHQLSKYFDESQLEYYRRRYSLWLMLTPSLCVIAIVLGALIGR